MCSSPYREGCEKSEVHDCGGKSLLANAMRIISITISKKIARNKKFNITIKKIYNI